MLKQESLVTHRTRGNMAIMKGVNKVLGGDVGAQSLHLDFDMDEVIYWKQTTVFLPSSK